MRQKGLRITSRRNTILDRLLSRDGLPSERKFLDKVKNKAPRICPDALHGTLVRLFKNDMIKESVFEDMEDRCEGTGSKPVDLACVPCSGR